MAKHSVWATASKEKFSCKISALMRWKSLGPSIRKSAFRGSVHFNMITIWGGLKWKSKTSTRRGIRLESESVSSFLYSSPSAPGTSLRLEPGQWIVARFDFILEADYKSSVGRHLRSGKADIVLRWRQALDTWRREGCKIETGYYNYDYGAEAKPVFLSFGNVPSR